MREECLIVRFVDGRMCLDGRDNGGDSRMKKREMGIFCVTRVEPREGRDNRSFLLGFFSVFSSFLLCLHGIL